LRKKRYHDPVKFNRDFCNAAALCNTAIFMVCRILCWAMAFAFPLLACGQSYSADKSLAYQVIRVYPHDPSAYTQGLIYLDGFLYESTGREGQSSIRKVELQTGKVLQRFDLPGEYFGEGVTDWEDKLLQLTWKSGVCFVYDRSSFHLLHTFHYEGEGWGLTHDDKNLIMSDGTPVLRFLNPDTFKVMRRVKVTYKGHPVDNLNELEYIRGEIYANVWMSDRIAIISPKNGKVLRWIDLSHLFPHHNSIDFNAVLNGIAYDAKNDRLFVTGKLWPKLFEIKLDH
jgi:glutaminyl-peptide cyclotransferase